MASQESALKSFLRRTALMLCLPLVSAAMLLSFTVIHPSSTAHADPPCKGNNTCGNGDTPVDVGAACDPTDQAPGFFGLPTWWQYMHNGESDGLGGCNPTFKSTGDVAASQINSLFPIGLAVLEILLHIAGIAAVVLIMIAGVVYITSSGNPEKAKAGRTRIINALVGLAIVLVAAAIVAFIGDSL